MPGYEFTYFQPDIRISANVDDLDAFGHFTCEDGTTCNNTVHNPDNAVPASAYGNLKTIIHPSGAMEEFMYEEDRVHYYDNNKYITDLPLFTTAGPKYYWDMRMIGYTQGSVFMSVPEIYFPITELYSMGSITDSLKFTDRHYFGSKEECYESFGRYSCNQNLKVVPTINGDVAVLDAFGAQGLFDTNAGGSRVSKIRRLQLLNSGVPINSPNNHGPQQYSTKPSYKFVSEVGYEYGDGHVNGVPSNIIARQSRTSKGGYFAFERGDVNIYYENIVEIKPDSSTTEHYFTTSKTGLRRSNTIRSCSGPYSCVFVTGNEGLGWGEEYATTSCNADKSLCTEVTRKAYSLFKPISGATGTSLIGSAGQAFIGQRLANRLQEEKVVSFQKTRNSQGAVISAATGGANSITTRYFWGAFNQLEAVETFGTGIPYTRKNYKYGYEADAYGQRINGFIKNNMISYVVKEDLLEVLGTPSEEPNSGQFIQTQFPTSLDNKLRCLEEAEENPEICYPTEPPPPAPPPSMRLLQSSVSTWKYEGYEEGKKRWFPDANFKYRLDADVRVNLVSNVPFGTNSFATKVTNLQTASCSFSNGQSCSSNTTFNFDLPDNLSKNDWLKVGKNDSFDENGRLIREADALGNITEYVYGGGAGQECIPSGLPQSQLTCVRKSGLDWKMRYDNKGKLSHVINENGNLVAQYLYDGMGRLKYMMDGESNIISSYNYLLARDSTNYNLNRVISQNINRKSVSYFDSFGRATIQAVLQSNGAYVLAATEYDHLDRVIKTTKPVPNQTILESFESVKTLANQYYNGTLQPFGTSNATPTYLAPNAQGYAYTETVYDKAGLLDKIYQPGMNGGVRTFVQSDVWGEPYQDLSQNTVSAGGTSIVNVTYDERQLPTYTFTNAKGEKYLTRQVREDAVEATTPASINFVTAIMTAPATGKTIIDNRTPQEYPQNINEIPTNYKVKWGGVGNASRTFTVPKSQFVEVLFDFSFDATLNQPIAQYQGYNSETGESYMVDGRGLWKDATLRIFANDVEVGMIALEPTYKGNNGGTATLWRYKGQFIAYSGKTYRVQAEARVEDGATAFGNAAVSLNFQKDGKVLCPHDTRFEYDTEGRLTRVYPPNYFQKAQQQGAYTFQTVDGKDFTTRYRYNRLGQLIAKETPDAGLSLFRYDDNGNLRYSQDAQQRVLGKYAFTRYDALNRPVMSGELIGNFDALNPNIYPTSEQDINNAISWNCYDMPTAGSTNNCLFSSGNPSKISKLQGFNAQNPKGQLVVSAYRTESTSSGSLWQVEAYSYNKKGNLEKKGVYTDLSNSSALLDLTLFYEYNLLNEVAKVKKGIGADTLYESYTYNTLGQVVDVYSSHEPIYIPQLTCEDEEFCFVEYFFNNRHQKTSTVYTPLGQVQRHRFHKAPLLTTEQGTVELYGMNYQYDIRDRLSAINSVSSAQYGTEKFAARYHYNEVSQLWKAEYYNPTVSSYSNFEHRYQMIYNYDSLNRLKETYYQSHKDYNAWNSSQGYEYGNAYQEQLAYDANGNVLGLKRTDKIGYMVDHLSLTYKSGTNQLMSVSDAAGANKLQGWDAGSSTNQYDLNGNLISGDGATNIVYDVRNLPIRMQKGGQTIVYRYNAAGQRIYKKVMGTTITEEHYVMNGSELVAVLKNGVVDYWKTSYGRYERSSGTFRAKYYITDHLGSTRVVLDESGQRVEAYDYYAFGLVLPGRGFGNTTKEKFTGKERDSETGWDYFGARYYNPSIARWMNVDPMADKYPSWSPYNYVMNSPLMAIDPDGMEGEKVQKTLDLANQKEIQEDKVDEDPLERYNRRLREIDSEYNRRMSQINTLYNEGGLSSVSAVAQRAGLSLWATDAKFRAEVEYSQAATGVSFTMPISVGGLSAAGGGVRVPALRRSTLREFSNSAKQQNGNISIRRGGLTNAGRQLSKHSIREGTVFTASSRDSATLNREGQAYVDDILFNPNSTFRTVSLRENGRTIHVTNVRDPHGRIVSFDTQTKQFRGFREPNN